MNFALITEGVSEHRVIKHFILKYLRDCDPDINQIQPPIANNKQQGVGGWNEVLKYCGKNDIKNILDENDYLVIQIDTDMSETEPFGVPHLATNGQLKTFEVLYEEIVDRLVGLIQPEILQEYHDRIVFAICIHTIECWLLPKYCSGVQKSTVNHCINPLNNSLRRKNMQLIPREKNSPNGVKAYNELLTPIKKADIIEASIYNLGLLRFVNSLEEIDKLHGETQTA